MSSTVATPSTYRAAQHKATVRRRFDGLMECFPLSVPAGLDIGTADLQPVRHCFLENFLAGGSPHARAARDEGEYKKFQ